MSAADRGRPTDGRRARTEAEEAGAGRAGTSGPQGPPTPQAPLAPEAPLAPTPAPTPMSGSTRTTLVAGVLVGLSAVLALVGLAAASSLLHTAGPLLALAGAVLLVVGVRGETGLGRVSALASAGIVLLFVPDVVGQALSSTVRELGPDGDAQVLLTALAVLRLASLAVALAAVVVVLRRRLLEPWTRRALVAVVAVRAFFAVLSFVPSVTLELAVVTARVDLLVPVLLLALGVALALHGRGDRVRARTGRGLEAWRSSTDVVRR